MFKAYFKNVEFCFIDFLVLYENGSLKTEV